MGRYVTAVHGIEYESEPGITNTTSGPALKRTRAMAAPVASKTAAYTAGAGDEVLLCNASGGAFTVTLPTAAGIAGRRYTVVKVDNSANAVTVDGNGAETINGAATHVLSSQWGKVTVVSDGASWVQVG